MCFLLRWQHVGPGQRLHGRAGLERVVAQLQGFEAAAAAWERDLLPARLDRYDPAWLDGLCLSGQVVWGRLAARAPSGTAPTRAAPITLAERRSLPTLLAPREDPAVAQAERELDALGAATLAHLRAAGASFADEIAAALGRRRREVEGALWELVGAGLVTGDGFAGLRALLSAVEPPRPGRRPRTRREAAAAAGAGRWALLRAAAAPEEAVVEAVARQYLARYGVVFRDLVAREPAVAVAGRTVGWRDLLLVYRRLEARGELRAGRLVAGFVGEQFALPAALEALRGVRRLEPRGEVVRVAATDPLNLVGVLTPGPRVPALLGGEVVYRDGVPDAGPERGAAPSLDRASA